MKWSMLFLALIPIAFNTPILANDEVKPLVIIKKFKFIPQEITVKRGQTIRWENREKYQYHNVWFEAQDVEEPEYLFPDDFYERDFKQVGTFTYRCGPHPEMTGIVHVLK